ncbi:hypothetical protein GCM10027445_47460 [Amycolatopsis endophytica]|uniref:Uncharacterized protein n=1 Tax=Amycolatopsis endophytica TaxID=860233 RepID=A0A853AYJ1_9PSEU|nr:hypothetical protein [Amycolatopsis endophytica]NYI87707.1 hypothetical protein [Amycolatopsis endophytica]
MAEQENPYSYDGETTQVQPEPRRRGVDVFTLVLGIATLLVSGYVLSDGSSWLPSFDLKWVLAGGAVFVGILMLGASMRGGRRD